MRGGEDDSGRLKETLRRIDGLRGSAREEALQASLGIGRSGGEDDDDGAMRDLAEAIESAVRGNRDGVLGLDWSVRFPERE
jgi:zinc finger HIT domain-containing protein 3